MLYITLIIALALLQYLYFVFRVGSSRGRYGVDAPATTGNEEWEKLYRVQANTMEQLIVFIPAIYMAASFAHLWTAVGIGIVYLIGRTAYAWGYRAEPGKRAIGMLMTFFPNAILVLMAIGGVLYKILMA